MNWPPKLHAFVALIGSNYPIHLSVLNFSTYIHYTFSQSDNRMRNVLNSKYKIFFTKIL